MTSNAEIDAMHAEFRALEEANRRGEFGPHPEGLDPDTECLACERFNQEILRAGGSLGWSEEELAERQERRRQAGEVVWEPVERSTR